MRNKFDLIAICASASLLTLSPLSAMAQTDGIAAAVADTSRQDANVKLDEARQPATVLDFSHIKSGSTVIDLVAGNGYFTEMLADLVGPRGVVMPVNPPGFHEADTWAKITKAHHNIMPMIVAPGAMQFAPDSVDMIFTHLVYHDLYWTSEKYKYPTRDVDALMANWFAAVKPGGSVIVVDHVGPAGDTRALVEKLHRIDPATVKADLERAGFMLEDQSDALANPDDDHSKNVFDPAIRGKTDRFMMRFRKPE